MKMKQSLPQQVELQKKETWVRKRKEQLSEEALRYLQMQEKHQQWEVIKGKIRRFQEVLESVRLSFCISYVLSKNETNKYLIWVYSNKW